MSSVAISLVVFATVFGGALLGIFLRGVLPPHHLSAGSKDIVRIGMGLVGTMAALVLGLLVASAKSSYDSLSNELTELSANVVFLDRVLAHYGPEAQEARDQLRSAVARTVGRVWPKDRRTRSGLEPVTANEVVFETIQQLSPKDKTQRILRKRALETEDRLLRTRWLMYEQGVNPIPLPMLVVLVLWLTIIFISFGIFAPRNGTVVVSLCVAALSVSCAILLILEMYQPFEGIIQISSAPLHTALAHLGR
jgi:Protein of unknown function (DUF4239)